MAESKKVANSKSSPRANSLTPSTSDRNVKKEDCSEELASIGDTIEEYSDEGFDDEDGEYDEHMTDRRVRFRVGATNIHFALSLSRHTYCLFQFHLYIHTKTLMNDTMN